MADCTVDREIFRGCILDRRKVGKLESSDLRWLTEGDGSEIDMGPWAWEQRRLVYMWLDKSGSFVEWRHVWVGYVPCLFGWICKYAVRFGFDHTVNRIDVARYKACWMHAGSSYVFATTVTKLRDGGNCLIHEIRLKGIAVDEGNHWNDAVK